MINLNANVSSVMPKFNSGSVGMGNIDKFGAEKSNFATLLRPLGIYLQS